MYRGILLFMGVLINANNIFSIKIYVPSQCASIQKAIDLANDSDQIIVEPGIYKENLMITKAICLYSKFMLNGDTSYISKTIIDGNLIGSVITIKSMNGKECTVSGFTITHGYSKNLYYDKGLTLGGGSGVYIESSCPKLEHLRIVDNKSPYDGGGAYIKGPASPVFNNIEFIGNVADRNGGAFYCYNASPSFDNCMFKHNTSGNSGGACFFSISSPVMYNCCFTQNMAGSNGGAINYYCNNSLPAIIGNVTIVNNTASGKGGGIYFTGLSSSGCPDVVIANSVIWNNKIENLFSDADFRIKISQTVLNGSKVKDQNLIIFENIINFDPLLNNMLVPSDSSLCIDAANPEFINKTRIVIGYAPDIGCFESTFIKKTQKSAVLPSNKKIINFETIQKSKKIGRLDTVKLVKPKPIKVYPKPFK